MNFNWKEYKQKELSLLKEKIGDKSVSLVIIQVGNNPASNTYVKQKLALSKLANIHVEHIKLAEDIPESELLELIDLYNTNSTYVDGIIVQLPLPKHINSDKVINSIAPNKDVDGLTAANLGNLVHGKDSFVPCTPKGVMEMLNVMDVELTGKKVVILGRSKLVGLPLYHLLLQKNATPIMCHSKTSEDDKKMFLSEADIVISAVGAKKPFITKDMIKEGAIVIDVSIEVYEDTGKLHGDVCEDVKEKASYVTPVPGGVGQMTVLELARNTYEASLLKKNIKEKIYLYRDIKK